MATLHLLLGHGLGSRALGRFLACRVQGGIYGFTEFEVTVKWVIEIW